MVIFPGRRFEVAAYYELDFHSDDAEIRVTFIYIYHILKAISRISIENVNLIVAFSSKINMYANDRKVLQD